MNKDEIGGNWKQFKGKAKEQWGKLTDDDMTVIEGKRDQLVGKIQERYGYEKDQAEKEVGYEKDQAEKEVSDWEHKNDYRW
ncbi:TPA: CsbD family protein [Klebsiella pneumoniae]|uniref:CsbD family protein n=1 Tax=Klebsiella pneumoniae TaxID=573 RepID=UPI002856E743|nr:CsbD family protein [Klebsiella pneumoniae]HCB2894628.1 CsbD family protein [Klebsiella pneumoniae]HCB3614034.1 CsbD family protein [Klebsiella pneumoniae]HCM5521607.1 CsbD family protein [Klebsiella pneumoniae]HCM6032925.1 CsbD family protein [Klebsiella pneumoniae]